MNNQQQKEAGLQSLGRISVKYLSTFLVMVAENKKVRLSLGITFKILSTWGKKKAYLERKASEISFFQCYS